MTENSNAHSKKSNLSPKQEKFVNEFLVDLNATQAAVRAGYSKNSARRIGSQNLSKLDIQEALRKRRQELMRNTKLTPEYVLNHLKENVDRAMTSVPVLDKAGKLTGYYTYQGNVANRSLELIGKHLGMFTERIEITENVTLSTRMINAEKRMREQENTFPLLGQG